MDIEDSGVHLRPTTKHDVNAKRLDVLNKTDGNGMRFVGGVSDCDV